MSSLTELPEWQALQSHQQLIESQTMREWFATQPLRFHELSLQVGELLFDFSKNRVTTETLKLLCQLAKRVHVQDKINNLFKGSPVNFTEKRPALHTALRKPFSDSVYVENKNVVNEVHVVLNKMRQFTDGVRNKLLRSSTHKPFTDIVNIGIGGSHLGPLMAQHALADFAIDSLECHFISNIDSEHLKEVFKKINPDTTLFIISSKSFTTLETMTNAATIRRWLQHKLGYQDVSAHFVAVTAANDKAIEFGINQDHIFPIWDWVGGRYSVWSAIGLPLALMIGMDHFLEFLAGGYAMDQHLQQANFESNMPIILALLGVWYINFFGSQSHAIVPYSHKLNYFRAHLQQLDMESNGKRAAKTGVLNYATGPIIWGEHGCNGQHAFHQLLHQGQHFIPVDFILVGGNGDGFSAHHDMLVASGLSQAQALMQGKTLEQALNELKNEGYSESEANFLAPHKAIPGNRPSNILFMNKMTPRNLGLLLALYEHKIFIQGAIWNINSFDQWGVELGKQLLPRILQDLKNPTTNAPHDASTLGLIDHYKKLKVT